MVDRCRKRMRADTPSVGAVFLRDHRTQRSFCQREKDTIVMQTPLQTGSSQRRGWQKKMEEDEQRAGFDEHRDFEQRVLCPSRRNARTIRTNALRELGRKIQRPWQPFAISEGHAGRPQERRARSTAQRVRFDGEWRIGMRNSAVCQFFGKHPKSAHHVEFTLARYG